MFVGRVQTPPTRDLCRPPMSYFSPELKSEKYRTRTPSRLQVLARYFIVYSTLCCFKTDEMLSCYVATSGRGAATDCKMSAESRTLSPESPIRPMYFEATITRISYTLGRSCDPLASGRGLRAACSGRWKHGWSASSTVHLGESIRNRRTSHCVYLWRCSTGQLDASGSRKEKLIISGLSNTLKLNAIASFCFKRNRRPIDGIQYSGATVTFLGPTHRFLCSYGLLHGDSDILMFKYLKWFLNG